MTDKLIQKIEESVNKKHWAVFSIDGSEDSLPFAYTGGLTSLGIPELLITGGLKPELANILLNTAAEYLKKHSSPGHLMSGTTIISTGDSGMLCPLALVPASDRVRDELLLITSRYYEQDYPVLQLIWPDEHHNFPWDKSSFNQFKKGEKFFEQQPLYTETPRLH